MLSLKRAIGVVVTLLCCLLVDLPRVLSMPMQLYLPLGMMGRIECPIEANPAITQVVWTKDGHVVNFATLDRLKLTRQGTLVIETVVAADDGTYTCTPYSPIGAGKSSPPVQVNVRGKYLLLCFSALILQCVCVFTLSMLIDANLLYEKFPNSGASLIQKH